MKLKDLGELDTDDIISGLDSAVTSALILLLGVVALAMVVAIIWKRVEKWKARRDN